MCVCGIGWVGIGVDGCGGAFVCGGLGVFLCVCVYVWVSGYGCAFVSV